MVTTRRGFFSKLVVLAGGFAALSLKSRAEAQTSVSSIPPAKTATGGYRETDHVRAYYRSARG